MLQPLDMSILAAGVDVGVVVWTFPAGVLLLSAVLSAITLFPSRPYKRRADEKPLPYFRQSQFSSKSSGKKLDQLKFGEPMLSDFRKMCRALFKVAYIPPFIIIPSIDIISPSFIIIFWPSAFVIFPSFMTLQPSFMVISCFIIEDLPFFMTII